MTFRAEDRVPAELTDQEKAGLVFRARYVKREITPVRGDGYTITAVDLIEWLRENKTAVLALLKD